MCAAYCAMFCELMVNSGFSSAYGPGSKPKGFVWPGQVLNHLPVNSATPSGEPARSAPTQVRFGPPSSAAFCSDTLEIAACNGRNAPTATHTPTIHLLPIF